MTLRQEDEDNVCPHCGQGFVCNMEAGQGGCWCVELPVLPGVPSDVAAYFCPACLRELLANAQVQRKPSVA